MLWALCPVAAWGLSITGFSPVSGQPGNLITITGSGFNGATLVEFNNNSPTLADFTNVSDNVLLVVVPAGATIGPLEVMAGASGVSTTSNFLVAPVITSFSPQSGASPTMVSIMGANFVSNGTTVVFPGVSTKVSAKYLAPTEVAAAVPAGAGNGPITVYTSAGTNVSANSFLASALPTISSFSPSTATNGATVEIFGGNFFSPATLKFGSVTDSFSIVSTTEIIATVPAGAVTGPITVATTNGSATTTSNFVTSAGPIITGFSPPLGAVNSSVTIYGFSLSSVIEVTFNGVREYIDGTSGDTSLPVILTNNPGTGPIKVMTSTASFTTSTNFTNSSAPFVTDFNPVLGSAGTTVTIDGLNFLNATSVKFGGTGASFQAVGATQISATVPGISTGSYDIVVASASGSFTTSSNFTVTGAAPVITGFTPAAGVRGTSVTIAGANFTNLNNPAVKFNGVGASIQTPTTTTELIATVPAGASSGIITVANASGSAAGPALFYLQPWITSLSTNGGIVNETFTITGRNLTNPSSVQVNGLKYNFTGSASQIAASIPSNATSGRIEITTPGGAFISTNAFAILPKIYGFSPSIGPAGTVVTISGTSLFDVASVKFGGVSTPVSSATTNLAQVIVPASAKSGPLTVVTPYGNDTSTNSFTFTTPSTVVLTKTCSPSIAAPGTDITYTLLVTNEGPSIITSTVVTDNLPGGFAFASATTGTGTWTNTNGILTWDIGILTNGMSASLQIVGTAATAPALTNSAVLAFAEGNLAPYDNYASIINFFVSDSQRTLTIAQQTSPPGVVVSWPLSSVNFQLEMNTGTDLTTGWLYPNGPVVITNFQNIFTDSLAAPRTFFRLVAP
jgi:uncharacterized repeat protein (TIGR01451 family)